MKNRIDLAKYFNELGFKVGAEVGVADGRYSEILCQEIPDLQLMSIDPYIPYKGNWRGQDYQDKAFNRALDRLRPYNNATVFKQTSLNASLTVDNQSLDFVFIDGAHDFNNVMLDILLWTEKVRKGGIVSGHDYYSARTVKVIPAIDTYCRENGIKLNVIPRFDGGHVDDQAPCWWFIK